MRSPAKNILFAFLCTTLLLAGCGGGGGSSGNDDLPADPGPGPGPDTTPTAFSFADQNNVVASTVITSNTVTITGIDAPTDVAVTGGEYSMNGGVFTALPGTLNGGDTVQLRHTSSAADSTSVDTVLTVGGVSDTFTSTTAGPPGADTTPEPFSFIDQTGVATSTAITSAPVTITGIDSPAGVTVAGGDYSVGCTGTFISMGSTISNNETVCVRHTSSADASTATSTTLTVGGVADTFTSTTAAAAVPVVGLLPFLTGTGDLRLLDPTAAIALPNTNPKTVDSGLAPPPIDTGCNDCFGQAQTFFTGTVSGTTVSNLHAARLAYVKRAVGNDTGGMVFKLDITQGTNTPAQISSLTNACRVIESETTDFLAIDNSAVVIERAGDDLMCSETLDNDVTVIRLNSLSSDAGIDIPLALEAANPLHAQTNALGEITGYVSFEGVDAAAILVRRDASLANPVTLQGLQQTFGASIERTDLTHLFVTATPDDNSMKLFRVEQDGSLSPVLYDFVGFNAENPIQDGLHDATHLYFSDQNLLLRIPVDSVMENAVVMTTLGGSLRIAGHRALDTSTTPGYVVFDAVDDSFSVASGVFSVPTNASGATATPLANYPDPDGGTAKLITAVQGRAYINIADHGINQFPGDEDDALRIDTDGTDPTTILSAYWAGSSLATSFDIALVSAIPTQFIFLAMRADNLDGTGDDTLSVVDPATGMTGAVLGTVINAAAFDALKVAGLGRYALARAAIDRFGSLDNDVYFLDAETAGSLVPLAETAGGNDIPLLRAGN